VKLGLLTAPFPRRSLTQVADWAAGEGFEMLEVACWPAAGSRKRRYAGTSHIDEARVDVDAVRDVLDRHGHEISSLAYYPNNLHADPVALEKQGRDETDGTGTDDENLGIGMTGHRRC
jgi:sugar phosphate isomerase/epimerase